MTDNVRILVIEDETAVRMSLVAHLEDIGYDYIEAENGQRGIDLFRQEEPDLVLCDLRLPGVDGLDVLSSITEASKETPVIIVSGANQLSDAIQALKRGAWDYITKPIMNFQILDTAIQRALGRAQLVRKNREYQENLEVLNRQLSKALERLREDEETARALQARLLPQKQMRHGEYNFSYRMFPSMLLSGDFIDYFPIGDHDVGFYIADISGHGAASAFVTVMLKTLFEKHRQAFDQSRDDTICHPHSMLENLNHDICQSPIDKYLTIFYGVLNLQENTLRFCSGGQFPHPVLSDAEGVRYLTSRDKPVGLFEDSVYTEHQVALTPGCRLLMVSDGILELFPRDSAKRRTERLIQEVEDAGLDIDTLVDRFNIEDKKELPDDVAFLSVSHGENDE